MRWKGALLAAGVLALATSAMAASLTNGDFESGVWNSGVASSWTSYKQGNQNGVAGWSQQTGDGGGSAQNISRTLARDDRPTGVYQTIDANPGDAFTFTARAWCTAVSSGTYGIKMALKAAWAGGTDSLTATQLAVSNRPATSTWYDTGPGAGNATGTSVTLFLDTAGSSGTKHDVTQNMRWDNVIAYRAHVPPAPSAGNETISSIDVDVDEGGNLGNALAEYAITIGGGGYTLGTDWLQPGGTIGGAAAWQADGAWGTTTVGSLAAGTEYTFQVKARYSSSITQETWLGASGVATTLPEPATIALLGLGCLLLRRRHA